MRLVVADTAPLNYLVLIGHIGLLSALFERVFIPEAVRDELQHLQAPDTVREWIAHPPVWMEVVPSALGTGDPEFERLDDGERAAIELATRIGAELILMDDFRSGADRSPLGKKVASEASRQRAVAALSHATTSLSPALRADPFPIRGRIYPTSAAHRFC